jgi:hypothetical protein
MKLIKGEKGIFYREPGPGFRGNFVFVFMRRDANGGITRKIVKVEIGHTSFEETKNGK